MRTSNMCYIFFVLITPLEPLGGPSLAAFSSTNRSNVCLKERRMRFGPPEDGVDSLSKSCPTAWSFLARLKIISYSLLCSRPVSIMDAVTLRTQEVLKAPIAAGVGWRALCRSVLSPGSSSSPRLHTLPPEAEPFAPPPTPGSCLRGKGRGSEPSACCIDRRLERRRRCCLLGLEGPGGSLKRCRAPGEASAMT